MTSSSTTTGARAKRALLVLIIAASGLAMLAWSQPWFSFTQLDGNTLADAALARGDIAAPPLMALALAGLASVAGLALAGPVLRHVLGALVAVLGATAVATSLLAAGDPVRSVSKLVTELTGVSGTTSTATVIDAAAISTSAWPWVGALAGVLLAIGGIAVVVTARTWPSSGRRFEARLADADAGRGSAALDDEPLEETDGPIDRVDQWDALSNGDDPTGTAPSGRATD